MQVNQIASLLNDVFGEIIGESAPFAEDLSNIVSVGQTITASTQFGDNFDNYIGKIVDKVGLTLYATPEYRGTGPDIIRYGLPAASVIEKIRVDVGDFTDNKAWELTTPENLDFSDIWDFVPATVSATYYNKAITFKTKISLPDYQHFSAFRSVSEAARFISAIEQRILVKMRMAQDALKKRVVANLIAEKAAAGRNVVNLLTGYRTATGDTSVTAATALHSRDFLRYAGEQIGIARQMMREMSVLFNNADYMTATPPDREKMVFLTDFAKALEASLYADTFHEEYVKQEGFTEVAFWQGSGTTGAYADRAKIIVKPASDNTKTVTATDILAVIFDADACFIAGERPVTKALANPDGDFTNYWHKWFAMYYNDMAENAIVFTIADPTVTTD